MLESVLSSINARTKKTRFVTDYFFVNNVNLLCYSKHICHETHLKEIGSVQFDSPIHKQYLYLCIQLYLFSCLLLSINIYIKHVARNCLEMFN